MRDHDRGAAREQAAQAGLDTPNQVKIL